MTKPVRLYLVRHGLATGGWDEDPDPGLAPLGWQQADKTAETLSALGPLPIVTSPLRRTQETAQAFEAYWPGIRPVIDPRVAEVPSPTDGQGADDLQARREWLTEVMAGTWSDPVAQKAGPHDLVAWRQGIIAALMDRDRDTVFTTHFVAINVVVGHATGDDRAVCFRPDNGSVTIVEQVNGALRVVELGMEAETEVG